MSDTYDAKVEKIRDELQWHIQNVRNAGAGASADGIEKCIRELEIELFRLCREEVRLDRENQALAADLMTQLERMAQQPIPARYRDSG